MVIGDVVKEKVMTKEEFELGYAQRSGLTVDELHDLGLRGYPCDCDEEVCEGWQMLHDDSQIRKDVEPT